MHINLIYTFLVCVKGWRVEAQRKLARPGCPLGPFSFDLSPQPGQFRRPGWPTFGPLEIEKFKKKKNGAYDFS
jgi:hypothetical protein